MMIVLCLNDSQHQGNAKPTDAKISAIEFPVPTTKKINKYILKNLVFRLGCYYHSFSRNFSIVAAPLTDLLKTKSKLIWFSSCQEAFHNIKALLSSALVLHQN